MQKTDDIDYRKFARDLLKLCKKHNVRLIVKDCIQGISPANAKLLKDYAFDAFYASPEEVKFYDGNKREDITVND